MRSFIKPCILILLSSLLLIFSCDKGPKTDPEQDNLPVEGLPAVSGISGSSASFDAATLTYTLTVPAGTDIKALRLNIPLAEGATISPDPSTVRDYTNPLKYTITANGRTYQVTIKVEMSASTKSSAKQITTFRFVTLGVDAEIDQANRKITAKVSPNEDITKLVPTIAVSEKATVSPASGVAQSFTSPVSYTVTAEDGSKQVYEVKVEKEAIGGGRACLLTRIEHSYINHQSGQDITKYTDLSYNNLGQIILITPSSNERGYATGYSTSLEYDANGDLIRIKYNPHGYYLKLTYQNRKLVKLEDFSSDHQLRGDYIGEGIMKFNEKNELIEYNFKTEKSDGMLVNVTSKFEYVNGNITKYTWQEHETKETTIIEYEYDNKNSPLASSNPNPFLALFEIGGIGDISFGLKNNVVRAKSPSAGINLDISSKYLFNKNNYPISVDLTSVSGMKNIYKYYYSNCE